MTQEYDAAYSDGFKAARDLIGEGTLHDAVTAAKAGIVSTWGAFQAEGIVARPKTELKTRNGHRIITKIKCRDFVGSNAGVTGA